MTNFWKNKKVLITGATGFIGSHLVEYLLMQGSRITCTVHKSSTWRIDHVREKVRLLQTDISDKNKAISATKNQDIVMHLASHVAGISYNIEHPAVMFRDNAQLTHNILYACAKNNVGKLLMTSSACVYPRNCPQPINESYGFSDQPEPTNLGYGWSKRMLEIESELYSKEYGLQIAVARPFNTYGPRDHFGESTSHVIPGLIWRIFSGENPLKVWGSGKQTRSFVYATDFVRGLCLLTEKYTTSDPVNIGSSEEISIKKLTKAIVQISGKKITILFDTSKPDGQPRRSCDTTKAELVCGFTAQVSIQEGLKKTIAWYKQHLSSLPSMKLRD